MNQFTASLWGDEAFSAILSIKPIPEIIKIIINDTSPPLYNICEHVWFQIFGTSEIAIRTLSFLFFLLTIFFVYKIGELLWNKKTGFLAAALTFLNPFFFIYAFEGRMYSILALGVTASMYFFLRKNWPAYIMATTWAIYSHHFAIFALCVQALWFLYEFILGKRKIAVSMFKSFLVIGLLYLPWLVPLYKQTRMVGSGFWLGTPTLMDLINLIQDYLAKGIKHSLAQLGLAAVVTVFLLRNWRKNIQKTLFLASWFFLPLLLTWLVSQKFQSIFFNRYLLYAIPGAMLLLASNRKRKTSSIVLGITLLIFLIIDSFYFTHPSKRPFRKLASYVRESKRGDDFLINWNAASHHLWESKYYQIPAPLYIPGGKELPFFVGTALMDKEDIISHLPKKINRLGVITSGRVEDIKLTGYTERERKVFKDLKFIWYLKQR